MITFYLGDAWQVKPFFVSAFRRWEFTGAEIPFALVFYAAQIMSLVFCKYSNAAEHQHSAAKR